MSPSCHLGRGSVSYVHVIEMDRDKDAFIKELVSMTAARRKEMLEPALTDDYPEKIDEEIAGTIFDTFINMEKDGTVLFIGKCMVEKKTRWKKWRK